MTQRNINLTLTDAGRTALINAASDGTNVQFTAIALGSGIVALDATAEALTAQQEQEAIFSSSSPAPGQLSVSALFNTDPPAQYTATELGLIGDGVLFGVWSTTDPTQAVVVRTPGVPYTATITVGYAQLPSQNVSVVIQPLDAAVQALLTDSQTNTINNVFSRMAPIADTGAKDAYAAANFVPLTAQTLVHGTRQRVTIATTNDGPSTYAPDGLPPKPILGTRMQQLGGGELVSGLVAEMEYIVAAPVNAGNGAWMLLTNNQGSNGILIRTIGTMPTTNVGPVLVSDAEEIWTWKTSQYFSGYRSKWSGAVTPGITAAPRVFEVDGVGGNLSKAAYAGMWGVAQEEGLVVALASWTAGTHFFADNGDGTFRTPDLRNQFQRFTGTNADTANARVIGSAQIGAFENHVHVGTVASTSQLASGTVAGAGLMVGYQQTTQTGYSASGVGPSSTAGTETRPANVAYAPRIHI